MRSAMLVGTAVLALAAGSAFAQQPTTAEKADKTMSGQKSTGGVSGSADRLFITNAAKGGLAEVQLGQLASDKGTSAEVKQFGQRMVSDHSKANDELKSLAQSKNITLPSDLDAKDKALHDRLSKMSGEAFDRAYMQHMLADHKKDVSEFRKESSSGKDPDVKAWASKTLPTLEEHLKMAQDANKAVGTSGSKSGSAKGTKGSKNESKR